MAADSVEFENGLHESLPISEKVNGSSNGDFGVEELSANLEDSMKLRDHSFGSDNEIVDETPLQPQINSTVTPQVRDLLFILNYPFENAHYNVCILVGT